MFAALWRALVLVTLTPQIMLAGNRAEPYLAPIRDVAALTRAIESERSDFVPPAGVTGISVPHHMLAADLIARGFWAASGQKYKRVIVLSPDHFRLIKGRFATSLKPFTTVFGSLAVDRLSVERLLLRKDMFESADLSGEHGLQAEMPFIRHFFPDAEVIPVLASIFTTRADWAAAADLLAGMVDKDTLIVQSTDYSHYLPIGDAVRHDQETMAAIAAGERDAIASLSQPDHMDSKASEFIQLRLQTQIFGARATIVANRNSVEYGGGAGITTSYIVSVFHPDPAALSVARYKDQSVQYLAGDTLFGRYFLPSLADPKVASSVVEAVRQRTAGGPLIINLEGTLVDETVTRSPKTAHLMHTDLAGPLFRALNVIAAGLANNHSEDFGQEGLDRSIASLKALGVRQMTDGDIVDFGAFRLMPLLLPTSIPGAEDQVKAGVETVCKAKAEPPIVVFAHWGEEYTLAAGPLEAEASRQMADCGAAAIIGAHSHQASLGIDMIAGRLQMVFSLGNFIFDQNGRRSSGALAELRVFHQGTVAVRLIPLPNLFDLANADRHAGN